MDQTWNFILIVFCGNNSLQHGSCSGFGFIDLAFSAICKYEKVLGYLNHISTLPLVLWHFGKALSTSGPSFPLLGERFCLGNFQWLANISES